MSVVSVNGRTNAKGFPCVIMTLFPEEMCNGMVATVLPRIKQLGTKSAVTTAD